MDKAPVYGTGDSRFDPWQNHVVFLWLITHTIIFYYFLNTKYSYVVYIIIFLHTECTCVICQPTIYYLLPLYLTCVVC